MTEVRAHCEVGCYASASVRDALAHIDRSEDVRFSPDCRRLAFPQYDRNSIAVATVKFDLDPDQTKMTLSDVIEYVSPRLNKPHSVEFLDDEMIVVANRYGDPGVFQLPRDHVPDQPVELTTIDFPADRGFALGDGPSAVRAVHRCDGDIEVLICQNYGGTVTSHVLQYEGSAIRAVKSNDLLLRNHLAVPDGVDITPDGLWVAVSNHGGHRVMVYERSRTLDDTSGPDGILRGAWCPHGICFGPDGRSLFVADTYSQHVHVYLMNEDGWRGVQFQPAGSVRVVDDDAFRRWHRPPGRQAGPKGIDIDRGGRVLAVTFEHQPPAFYDVPAILEQITELRRRRTLELTTELALMAQERLVDASYEARISAIKRTASFRLTKPLRMLKARWLRKRH